LNLRFKNFQITFFKFYSIKAFEKHPIACPNSLIVLGFNLNEFSMKNYSKTFPLYFKTP